VQTPARNRQVARHYISAVLTIYVFSPFFSPQPLVVSVRNAMESGEPSFLLALRAKPSPWDALLTIYVWFSPVCDSYVRPETLVRICDECNFGTYGGRCIICGSPGEDFFPPSPRPTQLLFNDSCRPSALLTYPASFRDLGRLLLC
jgi:PHF5-like protein